MLFVRIAIAILSVLLVLLALAGTLGALLGGLNPGTFGLLATLFYIACCGITGLLSVPVYKHADRARRMSLLLNGIYLVFAMLGFAVMAITFMSGDATSRAKDASVTLGVTFLAMCATILYSLLVKLGDAVIEKPKRSIPTRITLIGLLAFMGTIGLWAFLSSVRSAFERINEAAVAAKPRPESIESFPEFNYTLRSPGGKWLRAAKGTIVKDASLVLVNATDKLYFVVIAENLGETSDSTVDALMTVVRTNMESAAEEISFEPATDIDLAGIPGKRFESKVRIGNVRTLHVYGVAIHAGVAYQLITWGSSSDSASVLKAAADLQTRFSLIDAKPAHAAGSERLESAAFGVNVDLKDSGWVRWKKGGDPDSTSEFGARFATQKYFQCSPVFLPAIAASDEAITNALLGLFSFTYPGDGIIQTQDATADGLRIQKFSAERTVQGSGRIAYRIRTLRRGEVACVGVAWQAADAQDREQLDSFLDRISLTEVAAKPEQSVSSSRQALFINNIGIHDFNREKYKEALVSFQAALELSPKDAAIAANVAKAFGNLDRHAEGADFLASVIERFPADKSLAELHASALTNAERHEQAGEAYGRLLTLDPGNTEALGGMVRAFIKGEKPDRAEMELRKRQGDSPNRVLLASIRRAQDKPEEAITILREGMDAVPIDTPAGEELIEVFSSLDRYSEVIETSRSLEKSGYVTAYTLFERAKAERALDRLLDAKSSMEAALKIRPGEKVVQDALRDLETRLGRADSSLFSEVIEPVELPSQIRSDPAAIDKSEGAAYSLRAACWRFVPGKDFRQTAYYSFRINDRRGVDSLSSFSFEFDPTYERIYVNKLEVRDQNGKLEFTGSPAGYYTSSDSNASHASQSVTLHVPISGLAPGRTAELVISRRDLNPPTALPFRQFYFRGGAPAALSAVSLEADPAGFTIVPSGDVQKVEWDKGVIFIAQNQPAWKGESLSPPSDRFVPHISVGAVTDGWEALAIDYLKRIESRLVPDASVAELAGKLVEGAADEESRLRKIAAYVQQEYSYRALAFGPRAQIPTPVAEVVANRFGDCKDHSVLFVQLARAAGIRCLPALASTENSIISELPSLLQFNHMIAFLPASGRFVDLTEKGTDPLFSPPYGLNNAMILVLDPEQPRLLQAPDFPRDVTVFDADREVTIDGRGLIIHETLSLSGFFGSWLRETVVNAGNEKLVESLSGYFSNVGAQLTEARSEHAEDTSQPLRLRFTYKVPGAVAEAGGHAAITIPYIFEHRWFALDPSESRQDPLYIAYPRIFQARVRIRPDQYALLKNVDELKFDRSTQALSASRTVAASGDMIEIKTVLHMNQGQYTPSEFARSAEMSSEVMTSLEHDVVLSKKEGIK